LFQACADSRLLTDSSDAFDGVLGSGVVGNAEVGMAVGGVWEDSWGKGGCADWTGLDSGVFYFFVVLEKPWRIWGVGYGMGGLLMAPARNPSQHLPGRLGRKSLFLSFSRIVARPENDSRCCIRIFLTPKASLASGPKFLLRHKHKRCSAMQHLGTWCVPAHD
jgi:hypothetical protein